MVQDDERQTVVSEFTVQNYNTVIATEDDTIDSRQRKFNRIKRRGFYSVDEGIEYIGIGKYHYIWMFVFGLSSMAQAVEVTLSSVILSSLACEWDLNLLEQALVPCLVLVAAIPGDYLGGWLADRYGRKMIMITGQFIIAIFGVISAFMPDYYSFVAMRCCVGFGFGLVIMLVIVQVIELCPTAYRASSVSWTFIMWGIGDAYIVIAAYFLLSSLGWRAVVLAAALPCVILCFIIPFMDESPKFLVISAGPDKAKIILDKIAITNKLEPLPGDLESIIENQRGRLVDMFKPDYLLMSACLCVCMFMANFLYMGNIFATPYLFDTNYCFESDDDFDNCTFSLKDLILTLIVTSGEFVSVPLFAISSELKGRIKTAQILSFIMIVVVFVCLFCMGMVALIIELFLTRAFSNAILLLFYVFTPESYPTYMRSLSFGVVMLFANMGGVCAILIVFLVGLATDWTYMFYSFMFAAIFLSFTSCLFKNETVGVRLKDNRAESITPTTTRPTTDFGHSTNFGQNTDSPSSSNNAETYQNVLQ